MAKKNLSISDHGLNEALNFVIERVSSLPAASTAGRMVYLTTGNIGIYIDSGTSWGFIKRHYISKTMGAGVTGINPTATAATSASLTGTGVTFWTFLGTGGTTYNAAFVFEVPSDYLSGGAFYLGFTTETTTNNIKWQAIVTSLVDGAPMQTPTETGLAIIEVGTTAYNLKTSAVITPVTATFAPNKQVSFRVYRDPGHADDTATADAYLAGIFFEYTARIQ